jgi:DNA polymerase-3 subunit delta'
MSRLYPWQTKDWPRLQALRKRMPNGLLLKGAAGIGKFELAKAFIQSLLCQQSAEHGFACGVCPSCHWFVQGTHPDFRLLQPDAISAANDELEAGKKSSKLITVEQVRGLSDFLSMSAHQGGRRIVLIHPAEAMNVNAANALLKSLEEPTQGVLFVLVTSQQQRLLPTILSRCVGFSLTAPDVEMAVQWLEQQGVELPDKTLALSGYVPLEALHRKGAANIEERNKLLHALRQPRDLDVFGLAELLAKIDQVLVVQWLQQWVYDMVAMKLSGKLRYHLGEERAIEHLIARSSPLVLVRLQKHLQIAKREAQHTLNSRLFFESLLFTYCQLAQE